MRTRAAALREPVVDLVPPRARAREHNTRAVAAGAIRRSGSLKLRVSSDALWETAPAILLIFSVGFRQHSGWIASPCWSTVMSTTHGSPADRPFGDELSFTVAQPPASAVLAHTSAATATTTSGLRTFDLLVRMLPVHRIRFPSSRTSAATSFMPCLGATSNARERDSRADRTAA
jgi:hypothetical protein